MSRHLDNKGARDNPAARAEDDAAARRRFLFEGVGIAIWDEDFSAVKERIDGMRASGIVDFRARFQSHPDEFKAYAALVRIRDVNAAVLRLFGVLTKEDLIRDLPSHFGDDSWPVFREEMIALAEGNLEFRSDIPVRDAAGNRRWLALSLSVDPECRATWSRVVVSAVDVTAQRVAEKELRASEARYRALFTELGLGFALHEVVLDADGNPMDYVTLEVNPAFEKLLGARAADVVGKRASRILPPDELAHWVGVFGPVATQGTPLHYEMYSPANARHFRGFAYSPGRRLFAVIFEDVTAQREAEQAARQSDDRHALVLRTAMDGFWMVDPDGHIREVNDTYCRMSGYSEAELLAMSVSDLEVAESPEATSEHLRKVAEKGADRFESRHRRKDGSVLHVEVSVTYQTVHGPRIVAFIRDVSDRAQSEEERARLQAELLQAQKMESIGRLAGGVAHDFNNMLSVILGNVELALGSLDPAAPLHEELGQIQSAAKRSADLTRQLLAFARRQTATPRPLDLNATVFGSIAMLRRLIGEDIEVRWTPDPGAWRVRIDPAQIDQVLTNLCANARDAIAGSGVVSIATANVRFDDAFCATHRGAVPGEHVLLAVTDTGSGMATDVLDHIFEPFFTTKEPGRGTGLGLATVYGIVKQNDGYVHVESAPGHGTAVRLYLPRWTGEETEPGPVADRNAARGLGETILLVEDEAAILRVGEVMLRRLGYEVLPASSAAEALRIAETRHGEIDLLMTDVIMPDTNGAQLAERVRALGPRIRCLFVSGYTADLMAERGILDQQVHFIQKPFTIEVLAEGVRAALDNR